MLLLLWSLWTTGAAWAVEPAITSEQADVSSLGTVGGRPITDGQFEWAARTRPSTWTEAEARQRVMDQLVDETILYLEARKAGYEKDPLVRRIMADAIANDERGKASRDEYAARVRKGYKIEVLPAASTFDPEAPEGSVVATVDGAPVRVVPPKKGASRLASKPGPPRPRKELVDDAIDQEVLVKEATKVGYLEDFRVVRTMVQTFRQHALGVDVPITDEQLKARYDADPSDFGVPEKRHLYRLVVEDDPKRKPRKTKKLLKNLRAQLVRHPDEFEDVAGVWSGDKASRRRNGDLGWVDARGRVGVPKDTMDAAFALRVGQLSEWRDVPGGHELLLVRDVKPASIRPFEAVVLDVEGAVRSETSAERYEALMGPLRKSYEIRLDQDAIAKQPLPPTRRRR